MSCDVKSMLKEAREAIRKKDFVTSLKLSKAILGEDRTNYMALVFLGLSLQEIEPADQAPQAFRKAIEIDSNNPLAWNGLLKLYEKQRSKESCAKDLLEIYVKVAELEANENKLNEYLEKIATIVDVKAIELDQFIDSLQTIVNKNVSVSVNDNAHKLIALILSQVPQPPPNLLTIYNTSLEYIVNGEGLATKQHYHNYIKVLYLNEEWAKLLQIAETMHQRFSIELTPLEWICKCYNQLYVEGNVCAEQYREKAEKYCEVLLNIKPDYDAALLTKAITLFNGDKLLESRVLLKEVANQSNSPLSSLILIECLLKLHHYEEALVVAEKLRDFLCERDNFRVLKTKLNAHLMAIFANVDGKSKCGVALGQELVKNEANAKVLEYLIKCLINEEMFEEADQLLKDVTVPKQILLTAHLLHKKNRRQEALSLLESNTRTDLDDPEWFFHMAELQWEENLFEKSLISFLKAAKLDPHSYLCFLKLGNYYQKFEQWDKARRCYEKAVKLNNQCVEAAMALSKIYRTEKKWEYNIELLRVQTEGVLTPENSWVWLQLGLSYMEQKDYMQAIDTLRYVIRTYPNNGNAWESLADAYMARGAYTSALKSYQQAAELTNNKLYPLLQIAIIKQVLGQLTEARADFENILCTNSDYVPALKGGAETCLHQAQLYRRDQLLGLSRDCIQSALNMLTTAIQQQSNLSCLWKLAGDCCAFAATLPEKYCCLMALKAFAMGEPVEGKSFLEREELFVLSQRCYCKAISIVEGNLLLWHDLAWCYWTHARYSNKEQATKLYEKALLTVEHCVKNNATYWPHWNLLGNVALAREPKNYALAQHAFIQALTLDRNSAICWSNLGTLYLTLGELQLANEAYAQAQRSDPNLVNCWVGQALIAETLGHHEAMDLFRHSTQLQFHPQGALGYGHWVCKTLVEAPPHSTIYSIHNMHAVPVACDSLTWFTENDDHNASAWNMLGLIRERMGLKGGALQAFKNALGHCTDAHKDQAKINYARLLVQAARHKEAIEVYKSVKRASFNSGSGLALAFFKNKQYEESYETYDQALHWLTDDATAQSDLLVALASMAYGFQGAEAAKTLLFQSLQLKEPSHHAYYATLALGLLHSDVKLAHLVLKELRQLQDNAQCLPHYGVLLTYTYLFQGQHEVAVRELSKLIHRHPNQPALWYALAVLLLRLREERPQSLKAAARAAERAIKLGKAMDKTMDVTKMLYMVASASFLVGDHKQALLAAQRAVHCYPNVAESWSILLCALGDRKANLNEGWVRNVANYVKTNLDPREELGIWLESRA